MKEYIDVVAVIEGDEQTIPSFMPCDANALKDYIPKLISHDKPENVVYTYGSRLRERIDQVQNAIDYLKEVPYTRRAIAVTWRLDEDQKHNKNPPCLTQIVWNVSHGKLHQTCSFRSHDMYEGWPAQHVWVTRTAADDVARSGNSSGTVSVPLDFGACVSAALGGG